MSWIRIVLSRCGSLFRRGKLDDELDDELRAHLEMAEEENRRRGMSAEEARQAALREFGGVTQVRETVRLREGFPWLENLRRDLGYALRQMRKSPGFAATVVLTLALGIGANTAIFSVVNAVLLRPLPYASPGRLVNVSEARPKAGDRGDGLSWPALLELQKDTRVFSAAAGLAGHALTLTGRGEPADLSTIAVTPEFFSLFGAKPLLGRALEPADSRDGAVPAVVLSERLWRSRFGSDPGIVGCAITLDERAYTVVGVMPASFRTPFLNQADQVWIPLAQDPLFSKWRTRPPTAHWLPVIVRLRRGVSLDRARAELETISAGLARKYPAEQGWQTEDEPLRQAIVGEVKEPLLLLLGAVGLLLLIACANIANLLLTRATARAKEIGVRIALGASPRRIASQLLTESALLGLLGGAAGVLMAWAGVKGLVSLLPAGLPQLHPIRVDGAVLGFALALSVTASVIFGLAPVFHAFRGDAQANLREGSRAGEARSSRRARNWLAAGEVALAMVLLAGAGLLLRSFARLLAVSPGFVTGHVVKANISLPRYQYSKPEQWAAFGNELMTRLQATPGMRDSALVVPTPIADDAVSLPFTIAGDPPLPPGAANLADFVAASPRYFQVMGIALLRGRLFTRDDTLSTLPVALISDALARRYFPNENPLGRQMIFGFPPHGSVSRRVVGVVADIHDISLARKPESMMYVPFAQAPFWGGDVVVRSRLSTAEVAAAIRTETHSIDGNLPVADIESLPGAIQASVAEPRFRTLLLGLFSAIALVLAAIGLYGVVSFSVAQRTREIGVRMALGATTASVRRLVVGEAAKLALWGLAAGIPAALILTHFLSAMLFSVAPSDPLTFLGVALLLTLVALAAAWWPARRAASIDPMEAIREE